MSKIYFIMSIKVYINDRYKNNYTELINIK